MTARGAGGEVVKALGTGSAFVSPDWGALAAHVGRTIDAGLVPAVNMDTGFGAYLDDAATSWCGSSVACLAT